MGDYMLTGHGGTGWVDVAVVGASDMHEAIRLAERETGCLVSHGRGGILPGFDPQRTIDATTGEVIRHHHRGAKPEVQMGPPDVMRAIAAALKPQGRK